MPSLAKSIVTSQQKEIDTMNQILFAVGGSDAADAHVRDSGITCGHCPRSVTAEFEALEPVIEVAVEVVPKVLRRSG